MCKNIVECEFESTCLLVKSPPLQGPRVTLFPPPTGYRYVYSGAVLTSDVTLEQKQVFTWALTGIHPFSSLRSRRLFHDGRANYSQWRAIKRRCQCCELLFGCVCPTAAPEAQHIWHRESPSARLMIQTNWSAAPTLCFFLRWMTDDRFMRLAGADVTRLYVSAARRQEIKQTTRILLILMLF